jgi:hypothetical protein
MQIKPGPAAAFARAVCRNPVHRQQRKGTGTEAGATDKRISFTDAHQPSLQNIVRHATDPVAAKEIP